MSSNNSRRSIFGWGFFNRRRREAEPPELALDERVGRSLALAEREPEPRPLGGGEPPGGGPPIDTNNSDPSSAPDGKKDYLFRICVVLMGVSILSSCLKYFFGDRNVAFQPSDEIRELIYKLGKKINLSESVINDHLSKVSCSDDCLMIVDSYQSKLVDLTVKGLSFRALYELVVKRLVFTLGLEVCIIGALAFSLGGVCVLVLGSLFYLNKIKPKELQDQVKKDQIKDDSS